MKRKTMRTLFLALFIIGIIVGWFIPGDLKTLTEKAAENPLKAAVFDIPKKLGQLENEGQYFKYSVLAEAAAGGVELLRVDDKIPTHIHPKENHFVYIYKGKAKGTVGDAVAEVGPGQLIAIPAGTPHSLERIGDTPVEIILFSSPPFVPNDIVYLDISKDGSG